MESILRFPAKAKNTIPKKGIFLAAFIGALSFSATLSAENVLNYALKGSPHSLDPMTLYDVPTHSFNANLYEGLVDRNQKMELAPCLATEWKNIEPTIWRFTLRQNVKFHDGSPFTANDVVFSFERAKTKGSDISGSIASIKEMKIIDDFTIDVITQTQDPVLPAEIYSLPIFCKSWCEKNNATTVSDVTKKEDGYANRHANGTGPYILESYQAEVQIVLVKNPNWWGTERGNVDKAIFKPIPSDATRVAGLLSGDVDLIAPVPIQDVERVKADPKLQILEAPDLLTVFLGMNQWEDKLKSSGLDKNPFKDKRVREAFAHAIDIETIKTKIMRGYSVPNGLMVAKGVSGFQEDLNTRWNYDLEKSKKLMKEAGYPNGFNLAMD